MVRPGNIRQVWLLVLAGVVALAGCLEADTRGGEQVDEVTFSGAPTWDNGVGELMQLKCGICHQVPRGSLSPATVPGDLDLNSHTSPGTGLRGARDILVFIDAGILRGDTGGTRQMPLEYATPLTTAEIAALESWSAEGGP